MAEFATIQPDALYGEFCMDEHKYECQEHTNDFHSTQERFMDAKSTLLSLLPPSYDVAERWVGRESLVWAENCLAMLVTHEDSYSRLHFALTPLDDLSDQRRPLAVKHIEQVGHKFLQRVHQTFGPLYIRDGAWMSRPFKP